MANLPIFCSKLLIKLFIKIKNLLLVKINPINKLKITEINTTIKNPNLWPEKGTPTLFKFIPYAENIILGTDRTIVNTVSVFITIFWLLEIIEA